MIYGLRNTDATQRYSQHIYRGAAALMIVGRRLELSGSFRLDDSNRAATANDSEAPLMIPGPRGFELSASRRIFTVELLPLYDLREDVREHVSRAALLRRQRVAHPKHLARLADQLLQVAVGAAVREMREPYLFESKKVSIRS